MPDFDIDFSPIGREKVIKYVIDKYGSQCVAGIITFGTLASRAALKDVGRVLHVPFGKTDQLAKRIEVVFGRPFTLQETYERDPEFAAEINNNEDLSKVFQIAKQIEGLPRHASAHAAGIVITDAPLYRYCPLYKDKESSLPLVQYSMKYAEIIGLIKFDFLGVTALDVLAEAIAEINKVEEILDLSKIPFDDPKTFELMRTGYTRGIFQFETTGMTNLIQEMGANCIEDLVATVALYRPGPMENIPTFIRYKKGLERVNYIYPDLESILENTYGIIVYQEQIIKIVQVISGYTPGEADLFRRAIGKKIVSEMERYRKDFIQRTHEKQGDDISKAGDLFNLIETFANYGFNKAHAVAYAIVGYRGAYIKAHYTKEFMCASFNAEQGNQEKLVELIIEARKLNIPILPPCINSSFGTFTYDGERIIYSLRAIKNIGHHVVDMILENRPFLSIKDFHYKVQLNKREAESLIKAGALDCFKLNRGILYQTWCLLNDRGDNLLFSPELFVSQCSSWTIVQELNYEKDILGLYITKHPVELYPYKNFNFRLIDDGHVESKNIIGVLSSYSTKMGRSNNKVHFCNISDPNSNYECILMDEVEISGLKSKVVVFKCKVRNKRVIITEIRKIEDAVKNFRELHIKITNEKQLHLIHNLLYPLKSQDGVKVYLQTDQLVNVGFISSLNCIIDKLTESGLDWRAG
jgi:DNA polymerase-3 subunit alpha